MSQKKQTEKKYNAPHILSYIMQIDKSIRNGE